MLQPVKVVLVAFGFKLGAPDYIDFIFDVRSVPNPWKLNDFKVMRAGGFVAGFEFQCFVEEGRDSIAGARRHAYAAAGGSHAGALTTP